MIVRAHPSFPKLRHALESCLSRAHSFSGDVFRAVVLETPADLIYLSLEGSRLGARLNAPQAFTVLYASLDEVTARAEARRVEKRYSIPGSAERKMVVFGVTVELVIDLNDGEVQQALGISSDMVMLEDWQAANDRGEEALTQAVGRSSYEFGLDGVVYPSAALAGRSNIALFTNRVIMRKLFVPR
jgi:RES domain-containing protein